MKIFELMRCFYSPNYYMDLPHGHPFPMDKFRVSQEMLLQGGILRPDEIVEVEAASDELLLLAHESSYIEKIRRGALDRKEQIKLGLPTTRELFRRCATEVEGTRLACHAALEEGVGVCLAGGTHHAFQSHGEGYCVFNDTAIAIRDLQRERPGIKVMVVDTDAHQGNGTNSILLSDPNVFTYSIHVGRNYPSQKVDGSMDIEVVRYVEGEMYLKRLFSTLAAALESFTPNIVIWVAGADNHRNDRFGQMMLNLGDLQRRDQVILSALIRNRIPVAILYGGGYNREAEYTAKIHRNTVATAKKLFDEVYGKKPLKPNAGRLRLQ